MLLKTIFKESTQGQYKAEIHKSAENSFFVECYSPSGEKIKTEAFLNSSILYVENMATNWINSIKVLNG